MNHHNHFFRSGNLAFDDFCVYTAEDKKADLIDGVVYMASPDNTDVNLLFMWLGGLMSQYASRQDLGLVFGSRVAFQIDKRNSPEPDIAFLQKVHRTRVKRGNVSGPPDLAVEIVSPESVARDYIKKRALYAESGVPEYWIVDQDEKKTWPCA